MTVVGIDDTDSRDRGMCTTFATHRIAERIDGTTGGGVTRVLLVRLNPAVEYKTRGNAALAIHADVNPGVAFAAATGVVGSVAEREDPRTSPGVVVAPGDPASVSDRVAAFAREAVRGHHSIEDAEALLETEGYRSAAWGEGRGRIGALAAVGAWRAFGGPGGDWTHERIAYREADRRGTPREVDHASLFAAAEAWYPRAWDTVDRVEGEAVCVPHTPGPILYGIRGEDPEAVRGVAEAVDSEPVAAARTFLTNQGTDAHLVDGTIPEAADGRSYRLDGVVVGPPETREGGHVFLELAAPGAVDRAALLDPRDRDPVAALDGADRLRAAAFEPTKRFRDRVRALRVGDRMTACGEVSDGTLKLEKFALRERRETRPATPTCPDCGRRMESAGAGQGYRCRDCPTTAPGKVREPVDRDVETGWYEVPPCARRHVAKPLVRGGFDAPTHPER